jgi:hypothetical protein
MAWVPNPGPQTQAFLCEADELFYGGEAGAGKTDLGIGLALTEHKRSLLLPCITKMQLLGQPAALEFCENLGDICVHSERLGYICLAGGHVACLQFRNSTSI